MTDAPIQIEMNRRVSLLKVTFVGINDSSDFSKQWPSLPESCLKAAELPLLNAKELLKACGWMDQIPVVQSIRVLVSVWCFVRWGAL